MLHGSVARTLVWWGHAGVATECVDDIPWAERERGFDRGAIHVLWLCGLPYVQKRDAALELLAVPVPRGERYGGSPIYFSDVIVRRVSLLTGATSASA